MEDRYKESLGFFKVVNNRTISGADAVHTCVSEWVCGTRLIVYIPPGETRTVALPPPSLLSQERARVRQFRQAGEGVAHYRARR